MKTNSPWRSSRTFNLSLSNNYQKEKDAHNEINISAKIHWLNSTSVSQSRHSQQYESAASANAVVYGEQQNRADKFLLVILVCGVEVRNDKDQAGLSYSKLRTCVIIG